LTDDVLLASDLFLYPDYPDALSDYNGNGTVTQTEAEMFDNRWHRLLEFVEVPARTHHGLSPEFNNPLNVIRQPGQINLNSVRHPEVVAGLVDDPQVVDRSFAGGANYLTDQLGEAGRDWWTQFVRARDGVTRTTAGPPAGVRHFCTDPVTGFYLPGVAGSGPFRSLSHLNSDTTSIDQTFLRMLPMDEHGEDINGNGILDVGEDSNLNGVLDVLPADQRRRLFELGNFTEYQNGTIDPYIRHRILSKMLNNVSTRSNVFIVYVTVGFFEANFNPATGEVRIGGEYDLDGDGTVGDDRKWGFFVIDRSLAEEAYDPGTGTFANWRQLIKYQLKP
jgi:hypothetical protein